MPENVNPESVATTALSSVDAPYAERPRRALVTGASSGIGAATVTALARDGWEVIAASRRLGRLEELAAEQPGVRPMRLDIADPDSVRALGDSVDRLDLLVNNAGASKPNLPVVVADPDHWDWMFRVNVLGTLRVTQALMPALLTSSNALVVVIGSSSTQGIAAGGGGYAAVKSALSAMTTMLRKEVPLHTPLRITEINPGRVRTDFLLAKFDGDAEEAAKVYRTLSPGLRPLKPEDIAECIRWLATLPARVNIDVMNVVPVDQVDPGNGQRRTPQTGSA